MSRAVGFHLPACHLEPRLHWRRLSAVPSAGFGYTVVSRAVGGVQKERHAGPGASGFLAPAAAPHTSDGKAAKAAKTAKRAASAAEDVPGGAPVKKRKKKAVA